MSRPSSPGADAILDQYYPVLDHGFLALVDYMGNDEAIEHAARVSYGKGTRAKSKTRDLIRYLYRKQHTTPFEMCEMKFHMAMPIFVARQWIRHRTASVNEYSGRYSVMPGTFYLPEDWRMQSKTNNQGSSEHSLDSNDKANNLVKLSYDNSYTTYQWLDGEGVARELSRITLPVSNYTQWYWKIDLHNLMHFLALRTDSHAQEEIRVYANYMAGMVKDAFPLAFEAWNDYKRLSVSLSKEELRYVQDTIRHYEFKGGVHNLDPTEYSLSQREWAELEDKLYGKVVDNQESFDLPRPITSEVAFNRMFPEEEYTKDS